MNEPVVVTFDHSRPYSIIVGEIGVAYKQAGRYFNQAYKPAKLHVVKEPTPKEKEIEELRANYAEALTEVVALRAQIAKYQLQYDGLVQTAAVPMVSSETIIVDVKEGVVTTNPAPDAAQGTASRTLTLSGISRKTG